MKRNILFSIAICVLFGGSVFAGSPDFKHVATAPTVECPFGTGWYVALEGGANVYQDVATSRDFVFSNGDDIRISRDQNIGGFGGVKVGYVFGTGTFRPTIEEDLFYNGIGTDIHVKLNGTEVAHSSNLINSGAFLTNFIARFAFGKFQPYAGGGVGAYYAAAAGSDITINRTGNTFSTGGGADSGSLAFDVVAGADYYWTCKWSTFVDTNSSTMSLWMSATAISRLVSNW